MEKHRAASRCRLGPNTHRPRLLAAAAAVPLPARRRACLSAMWWSW